MRGTARKPRVSGKSGARSRSLAPPVIVGALALALAACGSSGSPSTSGGSNLTGSPIKVGLINEELLAGGDFSDLTDAVRAAVAYENKELNGISGHPLDLTVCVTDGSPESSARCANQLAAAHVAVVLQGADIGSSGSVPVLEGAKIPLVGGFALNAPELVSKDAFQFVGGPAVSVPVQTLWMLRDLKPHTVSVVVSTDPPAQQLAKGLVSIMKASGLTDVKTFTAAFDSADFLAPLTAATRNKPDTVFVLEPPSGCLGIQKAKAQLGITAKMLYDQSCADTNLLKKAGAGADGAYFAVQHLLPNSDDPQVKLYVQKSKQYGTSKAALSEFSQIGFQDVVNVADLMRTLGPDNVSPASITTAMQQAKDVKSYMSYPYTCDGNNVPGLPNAAPCDDHQRIVQWNGKDFTDVLNDWVTPATFAN